LQSILADRGHSAVSSQLQVDRAESGGTVLSSDGIVHHTASNIFKLLVANRFRFVGFLAHISWVLRLWIRLNRLQVDRAEGSGTVLSSDGVVHHTAGYIFELLVTNRFRFVGFLAHIDLVGFGWVVGFGWFDSRKLFRKSDIHLYVCTSIKQWACQACLVWFNMLIFRILRLELVFVTPAKPTRKWNLHSRKWNQGSILVRGSQFTVGLPAEQALRPGAVWVPSNSLGRHLTVNGE